MNAGILAAMAAFIVAGAFIFVLADRLRRHLRLRRRDRDIEILLNGRNRQAVLDEASYEYGHWQGENGYRIFRKHGNPEHPEVDFVEFAAAARDAEDWIIRQHLSPKA